MKTNIKHFVRVTALFAGLGLLGVAPVHAAEPDEDVPEIAQLGPEGQPVHPVVWDGEDMRHIAQAGPKGEPAPVVIRDGEGDPDIDRLGPPNRESQRHDVAGYRTDRDGA